MVWQRLSLDKSLNEITSNLCVDPSTMQHTICLFESTGSVDKRPYPKNRLERKLTATAEHILLTFVIQQPGIKLKELQEKLKEYEIHVSSSTICNFLHKSGFSYQKMTLIARQRNEQSRTIFANDVSVYNPEMLVFVDETGADRRNALRKYGYSIRGKPAKSHKLLCRGQHISVIAFMSAKGLLDCKVLHGSVNGDSFYELHTHLIAHLQPFNGSNPHSVVILHNASIHHTEDVVKAIEDVGAIVHFLPPYSPDLNPIEKAFSKVKML